MLYVIGLVAALGYMYLKGNAIESHINAQVAEYHAQEKQTRHDEPPDATYKEIRSSWVMEAWDEDRARRNAPHDDITGEEGTHSSTSRAV